MNILFYKLQIIFSNNMNYSTIFEFVKSDPRTIYVDETLGKYDLELNVEVQNEAELQEIIDGIKTNFGGITSIEIFKVKEYLKLTFLPE